MRTILLIMIGLSSFLSADFTRDDAKGIVTDNATGLMWQDDDIESQTTTWQDAIDRCEALSLGGFADWRLPNINELSSLVDDTTYSPSIDAVFQNINVSTYWSSTTYLDDSNYAWNVYFYDGDLDYRTKDNSFHVLCVRAGA